MRHHIERLRAKPEYERKRFAIAVSAGVTGLVAFAWVTTLIATGAFILDSNPEEPTFADASTDLAAAVAEGGSFFAEEKSTPEDLTVIETEHESTIQTAAPVDERTVIPF